MGLLVKLGVPCDRTLCDTVPVDVQGHVTVLPTATVSIAGFWLPLWALLNRMFPTTTSPDGPPPPPPPPPPPYVGDLQPASAASASKPITAVPIRISSSWVIRNKGTASITGATLAIAARWLYQTRRLRRARNSGTDLSDDGLHCLRQSAHAGRHSGPDRRWWRPPSSREYECGRCSRSWSRAPARRRSE